MGWVMFAAAFLTGTLFWTLAAATGARMAPLHAVPYAVLAMGSAAVMGVGVASLNPLIARRHSANPRQQRRRDARYGSPAGGASASRSVSSAARSPW